MKTKLTKISKLKAYKQGGLSKTTIIYYNLLPKKFIEKHYKKEAQNGRVNKTTK